MAAEATHSAASTAVRLDAGRLLVDGRRFTVLGAELHNSSSSTEAAIRTSFARAAALGANTVLAPVAWDLFEPAEGAFDYRLLDAMLARARELDLRLIVLWFGSWKNGMSTYAPPWIKLDTSRFARAEVTGRGRIEHLTPFDDETRAADARAFAALMAHLREADPQRTTLMVQVENECGLLGDARDRSAAADAVWNRAVPSAVIDAVAAAPAMPVHREWAIRGRRTEGTWAEVFGESAESEEAFMACAYADYLDHVAAAGRAEHDVPLFVNAWLDVAHGADELAAQMSGGDAPGQYPSGGPVIRVAPLWRRLAPTIDFLAPDIYLGDFRAICDDFRAASDVLFIPEMRRSREGLAQMTLAIAELGAIGVSPFGIDSLAVDDPLWAHLADGYGQLRAAAESYARYPQSRSIGFVLDAEQPALEIELSGYRLRIDSAPGGASPASLYPVYGFVIEELPGQVLVAGRGFMLVFTRSDEHPTGILSADEISGADGRTVTRRLNGDEVFSGKFAIFPGLEAARDAPAQAISLAADMTGIVRYTFYRY